MTSDARDRGSLAALEERLGHRFRDPGHLRRALTHSSHAHDHGSGADNEALEFYGDALLGFLIAEALCARHPGMDEGRLSRMKAFLVSRDGLARIARDLDLGAHLKLGRAAKGEAVPATDSILADALEAVLAAVHLDRDFKTALQERLQAEGRPTPRYRVGRTEGPPHRPVFHVDLLVDGDTVAHGQGRSKKEAEQAAAREALRLRGEEPAPRKAAPPAPKQAAPARNPDGSPPSPKRSR
jgi:ribonuclease-3